MLRIQPWAKPDARPCPGRCSSSSTHFLAPKHGAHYTTPNHPTVATPEGQFWILLLRMSLPLNPSSLCPPPQGRFLCPCLLHFTSLISSSNSPGRGNGWARMHQPPFIRKLKFREAQGLVPGGRIRSGRRASCPSRRLRTDLHTWGTAMCFALFSPPNSPGRPIVSLVGRSL